MPAYKRSDPGRLAREQLEIRRMQRRASRESSTGGPRKGRPVSLPLRGKGRSIIQEQARREQRRMMAERKRRGYGPPPREAGARVVGRKRPANTA